MPNSKKTLLLISILLISVFVPLISLQIPLVKATTSIDTYPYTISSPGDYIIGTGGSTETNIAITINADNVNLDGQNIRLTGSGSNKGVYTSGHSGITLRNLNFSGFSLGVQFTTGCNNFLVTDSLFYASADSLLMIYGCYNFNVTNIYGNGLTVHNVKAQDGCYNFFFNNLTSQSCLFGPTVQECWDFEVKNSHSYDCTTGGYGYIFDSDQPYAGARSGSHNYNVTDCYSNNCAGGGLKISDATNQTGTIRVTRYQSVNDGNYGIWMQNATANVIIKNCTISGDNGGFHAEGSSANVTVTQTVFNSSSFGVYTNGATNLTFSLNYFIDCQFNSILLSSTTSSSVLHSAYLSSAANNVGANTLNDTALALVVSKVGNGTVTPAVATHAVNGGNWSVPFTATPDDRYELANVTVNGVIVTSPAEITADSAMVATFVSDGTTETAIIIYHNGVPIAEISKHNGIVIAEYLRINGVLK